MVCKLPVCGCGRGEGGREKLYFLGPVEESDGSKGCCKIRVGNFFHFLEDVFRKNRLPEREDRRVNYKELPSLSATPAPGQHVSPPNHDP